MSRIFKNSRQVASIFEQEDSKQEILAGVDSSVRNMSFAN